MLIKWLSLAFVLVFIAQSSAAQHSDVELRRKVLNDLLAEQWEYTLRTNPVWASILGDKRWNDKLEDASQEFIDKDLEETKKFLARFENIDTTNFPQQEALNRTLMVRNLKMTLEGARFKPWEMPVSQFGGLHIDLPQLVDLLSFASVKDYEDYIARLKATPLLFDQTEIQMRKGMAHGLMKPRILLNQVAQQAGSVAALEPEKTPFARPFLNFPKSISEPDQKRLREQGLAAIRA
jgi:uncharacterized protein (DUF885 family)